VIRFRFGLTPLDQVAPWGREERRLHWFGLTDGWYWIQLGEHELLRYAPEILERRRDVPTAQHPYVDYYLARLWEDVISLTLAVMQPVPDDLLPLMSGERDDWLEPDTDEWWAAASWYDDHTLNLGYLLQAPQIRAWRTVADGADVVTVTWRHRDDGDIRFTAAPAGRVTLPAESFAAAARQLDRELMAAMGQRIDELERTGPPEGVQLDLDQVRAEHLDRSNWLSRRLSAPPATDWAAVRAGVPLLLR
jgi:hypothetical protein